MNDYRFGNYLTELRKRSGMTQQLLAMKLGVTDKAVSKWERDYSYPDMALFPKESLKVKAKSSRPCPRS